MNGSNGMFIILESVDSTNNYAMQQVHAGLARDGNAWFAIEQTKGKGRGARRWEANKGENIILSIAINTMWLRIYEQFQLSAAVSLACYDLFKNYDSAHTKIKWPNDIFWNDRKAGGILIENVIKGNIWQWSVIGIGINVNQTSFTIEKNQPVSLKEITGKEYDPVVLGRELHKHVIKRLNELKEHNFKRMLDEYNAVLYKKNERVKLKKQNIIFETTIKNVSDNGQLITVDTLERSFSFDEIEWML